MTTRHLFIDGSTQFALERNLWFIPYIEVLFTGTHLMVNRRTIDIVGGSERSSENRLLANENTKHHDPHIFICTTLWQENEQEMFTLTRTLIRQGYHFTHWYRIRKLSYWYLCKRLIQHNQKRQDNIHQRSIDDINYNLEVNIYFDNAFRTRNTKPKAYQDRKGRTKYNRNGLRTSFTDECKTSIPLKPNKKSGC